MKYLILAVGAILGFAGFFMTYVVLADIRMVEQDIQRSQKEILGFEQRILAFKDLAQRPDLALDKVYVAVINDMRFLARAHGLVCTLGVDGGDGATMGKQARPSIFPGLREVRMHGAFSGLQTRGSLLSLAESLSSWEGKWPVLFWNVHYEKDMVRFDMALIGL